MPLHTALLPFDKSTTLEHASHLISTQTSGSYHVQLQPDWAFGSTSFGGYLVHILVRAAVRRYSEKQRDKSEGVNPLSWNANFVAPAAAGAAEIRVDILNLGRRSSSFRAGLYQHDRLRAECTVFVGRLNSSGGRFDIPTQGLPDLPFDALQTRKRGVSESMLRSYGWVPRDYRRKMAFYASKPQLKSFDPPGTDPSNSTAIPHPTLGLNHRDVWWCYEPRWTPQNLSVLIDLMPRLHWNFEEGRKYWTATQSISCELRGGWPEGGWEWLFTRVEMKECADGKCILDTTLYDPSGKVVAASRAIEIAIPIKKESSSKPKQTASCEKAQRPAISIPLLHRYVAA